MTEQPFNVLFLCTGNSARSVLAESILNKIGNGRFKAFSAGSHPSGAINPHVLEFLEKRNFPTADLRSKSWNEFAAPDGPALDFVFTVCDNAAGEVCPVWPGQPVTAHWGVEDPVSVDGDDDAHTVHFADGGDDLAAHLPDADDAYPDRLSFLLKLL